MFLERVSPIFTKRNRIFERKTTFLRLLCMFLASIMCLMIVRDYLVGSRSTKRNTLASKSFLRSPTSDESPGGGSSSSRSYPRVTCMVVTSPQHHEDRARHIGATWGNKDDPNACHDTHYLTSAPHNELHNVIISNYSRYDELWGKVLEGFRAMEASRADWFLKADDDTFLVYRNLLNLLVRLNSSQSLYLGLHFHFELEDGRLLDYMSGGAGYVLSQAALRRLQKTHLKECHVPGLTSFEDVNMGVCMKALGVRLWDTRDGLGRPRFLPYPPWVLLDSSLKQDPKYSWLEKRSKYPFEFGMEHLSDQVISFHEVRNPSDLYLLQYLSQELCLRASADPFTVLNNHP